jgi:predicted  nucleic acid-binding Zn-ribbon protein
MEDIKKETTLLTKHTSKEKCNKFLLIIILLLLLSNILLAWFYYVEHKTVKTVYVKLENTVDEKAIIKNELDDLLKQYETLKTDNEVLNEQIEEKKQRILEIEKELEKTKRASYYQIAQYKKELETLRNILKSYIHQVDSLNTLNQALTKENVQVKHKYRKVLSEKETLSKQNAELTQTVNIARIFRALNVTITGLNRKGKPNMKARKVKKIQVCFTLEENKVIKPGLRMVYLRIARPDGTIITSSEENLFTFEGDEIAYTSKREIEYNQEDTNVCIYWTNAEHERLFKGEYYVDIFIDGKNIATKTFKLK